MAANKSKKLKGGWEMFEPPFPEFPDLMRVYAQVNVKQAMRIAMVVRCPCIGCGAEIDAPCIGRRGHATLIPHRHRLLIGVMWVLGHIGTIFERRKPSELFAELRARSQDNLAKRESK